MTKLTLSVNPSVVSQAKVYARRHGLSISHMVEEYLAAISAPAAIQDMPPVLRSVRGILKKADPQEYRQHLVEKYR
jgi:hypothetical protein